MIFRVSIPVISAFHTHCIRINIHMHCVVGCIYAYVCICMCMALPPCLWSGGHWFEPSPVGP